MRSTTEKNIPSLADDLARGNVDVIAITATAIPYLGNAEPVTKEQREKIARAGGKAT